jgi:hypothetical protein
MEDIKITDPIEIDEDNALAILVDILSNTPIWEKDPNVKICCKVIGAKVINLQAKIDTAVDILSA